MALTVEVGTVNMPSSGTSGTVTISLPAGTNPKLLILQALGSASPGNTHFQKTYGFVTADGGATQQFCVAHTSSDASTSSAHSVGVYDNKCLQFLAQGSSTIQGTVAMAGISDWTDTAITLTTSAMTSAVYNVGIQYMVLGGTELEARTGATLVTTAVTHDVALPAGWGRPEAAIFLATDRATLNAGAVGSMSIGWGAETASGTGVSGSFRGTSGNTASVWGTNMATAHSVNILASATALSAQGSLENTLSNWPTDGFRIAWADAPNANAYVGYVALKGVQIAAATAFGSTSFGTNSATLGFQAQAIAWMHTGSAVSGIDTTGSQIVQWASGFKKFDGTPVAVSNYALDDDAQGTMFTSTRIGTSDVEILAQPANATALPTVDGAASMSANSDGNIYFNWSGNLASQTTYIPIIAFGGPPPSVAISPSSMTFAGTVGA